MHGRALPGLIWISSIPIRMEFCHRETVSSQHGIGTMTPILTAPDELILKPTFPLDAEEISERIRTKKWSHPITWAPALAIAGVLVMTGTSPLGWVVAIGGATLCLREYWSRRHRQMEGNVIRELVEESNAEQDRQLTDEMDRLRRQGQIHSAIALGKFLLLKQRIEGALHQNGVVTPEVKELERIVDNLCNEVVREIHRIREIDAEFANLVTSDSPEGLLACQERRTGMLESIRQSYQTLREVLTEVMEEELPDHEAAARRSSDLEHWTTRLREETERARAIRERMDSPDPAFPRDMAQEIE